MRRIGSLLIALAVISTVTAAPVTLPRRGDPATRKDETYPGVVVRYDAIRDAKGQRLRLIVTYPEKKATRFPTIFVVGWLSCGTVEAPPGTMDATQLVLQAIAKLDGFATVRLDKAGVGDSEGDCAATDFVSELAEYRQAFREMQEYPFVDTNRLFLFGMSNGAGFAPLVAENSPVRGYVVHGGWIKTWYEHMLEIERRRLVLQGTPAPEINPRMKSVAELYGAYLLARRPPGEIFLQRPDLKSLWDSDPDHQYGRPVVYYQQLQDHNLMAAWSRVKVPVLALHGELDWIMSPDDPQILVSLVNASAPGLAEFVELPATGHSFQRYRSLAAAFAGDASTFDPGVAARITQWFDRHR